VLNSLYTDQKTMVIQACSFFISFFLFSSFLLFIFSTLVDLCGRSGLLVHTELSLVSLPYSLLIPCLRIIELVRLFRPARSQYPLFIFLFFTTCFSQHLWICTVIPACSFTIHSSQFFSHLFHPSPCFLNSPY